MLSEIKWNCSVVSDSLWPHGLYSPWNSLGQNTEVGSLSHLQGIFPTQGLNPGFLHCRLIFFYQLSHKGSPGILEWVTYPFSRGSSQPRNQPGSPALQVDSLPVKPQGKPKNTGVGSLSLLQQIFLTKEPNQGLLHSSRFFTNWAAREALLLVWNIQFVFFK